MSFKHHFVGGILFVGMPAPPCTGLKTDVIQTTLPLIGYQRYDQLIFKAVDADKAVLIALLLSDSRKRAEAFIPALIAPVEVRALMLSAKVSEALAIVLSVLRTLSGEELILGWHRTKSTNRVEAVAHLAKEVVTVTRLVTKVNEDYNPAMFFAQRT